MKGEENYSRKLFQAEGKAQGPSLVAGSSKRSVLLRHKVQGKQWQRRRGGKSDLIKQHELISDKDPRKGHGQAWILEGLRSWVTGGQTLWVGNRLEAVNTGKT